MTTDADRELIIVRERLRTAIEALSEVVIKRTYGYDEYTTEAKETMRNALYTLLAVEAQIPGNS